MLNSKTKYLQIALNSNLYEAQRIISTLPVDQRIIIEAGTPLIKEYGAQVIQKLRNWYYSRMIFSAGIQQPQTKKEQYQPNVISLIKYLSKASTTKLPNKPVMDKFKAFEPYIVADLKCMDRGGREVQIAKDYGASAAVVLGLAPIETINAFIENCEKVGIDAYVDMMNVEFPLSVLRQLNKPPKVVMLHRGVDEEHFNKEKEIPFHEIARIKNELDVMIAIAGGDAFNEVRSSVFNDADIVVIWKSVYKSSDETTQLVEEFLKEIR